MKSVKPGRGPSAIGVWMAVVAVIFGIFWTVSAASMGAPGFFPVFGVLFIITGIIIGVYHFKNATGKNRYSEFDITGDGEEPDPLEQRFGHASGDAAKPSEPASEEGYCPYCGAPAERGYTFCRRCGKQLPLS